jgi:N-acetylmuramoyl-L-alanine amidase
MLPHRAAPLLLLAAACAPAAGPAGPAPLPVPPARGPVAIRVIHPAPGSTIDARDSTFLLGSLGTGDATLAVNGAPVAVAPNGAFLAWVPLPRDSVMRFTFVARSPRDSQRLDLDVTRARWRRDDARPAIEPGSMTPVGRVWVRPEEPVRFLVRATPGATVRLLLPDTAIRFVEETAPDDVPPGIRAFDRDPANLRPLPRTGRYVATIAGMRVGADPGPVVQPSGSADGAPILELVRGADTVRASWPVQLGILEGRPPVVQLDDDPGRRGGTDGVTVGRAVPGGSYHWFFGHGTRVVLDRRQGDDARVRLSERATAWVPAGEVVPLPHGTWPPLARLGSITISADSAHATVRLPLGERVPVRVLEEERRLRLELFSAVGDVDWIRDAPGDTLVRRIDWAQATSDEVHVDVELSVAPWGWRLRWEGTDLLLDVRRPPSIDRTAPLRGRFILVDPGHPPAGATGPTGLREAEANLAVSLELRRQLEAKGARVALTRAEDRPLDLRPRVELAERSGAEVLVSVHNNALPDGVNPFTNSGTSVFYGHAISLPLARAVQAALVRELGERDLGVARGDLALVRPSWLPAILTEGFHLIVPEHEAALRSPEGQRRYARGIVAGLEAFLAARAR